MNLSPTQSFTPEDIFPASGEQASGAKVRSRRPCDPCRKRKSRCEIVDGKLPCLLCRFHRQECTFNEEPQPRKRRAVGQIDDQLAVNQARPPNASNYLRSQSSLSQDSKIRQDQPIDDYAKLRGPSLLKKTLGLRANEHSRLIGSSSEHEQLLIALQPSGEDEDISMGASVLRRVDITNTAFILTPDAGTENYHEDIPDLDAIETLVAPHGQALINLYFRIVHPGYPVLHKRVFLEKYDRTHREFSPPLLAAVYLLALNWWSYSTDLALLPKPDITQLAKLALRTMANIVHRPKLSTLQAGLLLLQRPEGDSWALTSQLVGLGQDLGLHLDCTGFRIPSWEKGLRKRLAWALFMQDNWGALVHSRPSHITPADWEVQPLEDGDFPENAADEDDEDGSTEVEKGRALFCEMIKLSSILGQILSSFYTLRAEREFHQRAGEGVRWILETAKPLQLALRQWFGSLPAVLKMEHLAARKLSSTGYLHLGYYAVEITLHRRIIRSLSSADDPMLRSICRQAAQVRLKSAMDFVSTLRPEHLQSFWYSASKYNFALIGSFISLLWATAPELEEAEVYKKSLDEYRWVLRLSSKSADFLEEAINMLASSTGVLVKAIPVRPDADRILAWYQNRARQNSAPNYTQSGRNSRMPSLAYQSDSELHDETSPENVMSETPSDTGAMTRDWSVDQAWFSALGDNTGVFDGQSGADASTAYLSINDGEVDFNFQQQHRQ